jgi:uncharacterized repeat protein (TIGR04138 family)
MAAPEQDLLEDKIQNVRRRDRRFSRNAYYFVLDALDYTMTHLGRDELTGEDRHIGGKELIGGIREYAADQFGPMATIVFERWGVRSSADFGEIVFNLIDAELLSRRPIRASTSSTAPTSARRSRTSIARPSNASPPGRRGQLAAADCAACACTIAAGCVERHRGNPAGGP